MPWSVTGEMNHLPNNSTRNAFEIIFRSGKSFVADWLLILAPRTWRGLGCMMTCLIRKLTFSV